MQLPPPENAPPPVDEGKGKKGKKKKGKKKGKLEPGMAEAQTYGSAVLRLVRGQSRAVNTHPCSGPYI